MGYIFLTALSPKQNVFCCFSTPYINRIHVSSPLATLRGRQTYALRDFFIQNLISYNFYLKLFFMGCVFLAALSPKQNVFCCFSTLYFNHIHLSSPLAPLRRKQTYALTDFFIQNSILYNFYLKFFLMGCVFLVSAFYLHIGTYINIGYVDCNDVTIHCPLRFEPTCVSNHLAYWVAGLWLAQTLLINIKPHSHSRMKSCECALIANVKRYSPFADD